MNQLDDTSSSVDDESTHTSINSDNDNEETEQRRNEEKARRSSHFADPDPDDYGRGKRTSKPVEHFSFLQTELSNLDDWSSLQLDLSH